MTATDDWISPSRKPRTPNAERSLRRSRKATVTEDRVTGPLVEGWEWDPRWMEDQTVDEMTGQPWGAKLEHRWIPPYRICSFCGQEGHDMRSCMARPLHHSD